MIILRKTTSSLKRNRLFVAHIVAMADQLEVLRRPLIAALKL